MTWAFGPGSSGVADGSGLGVGDEASHSLDRGVVVAAWRRDAAAETL